MTPFGFLGFGEVGACLSRALAGTGAPVLAYDTALAHAGGKEELLGRASGARIRFVSLEELCEGARAILSTVPAAAAVKAARACARHLGDRHLYIDLNSTLPGTKREIAAIVEKTGASFAEATILGAVEANGPRVHILMGGPNADRAAALLRRHGLNATRFSGEIGKATTFKLLRNIFYKGAEAALIECLLAARRSGMEAELWKDIVHTMDAHSFADTGSAWIRTHPSAHPRRAREMEQNAGMARDLGLDMTMSRAAGSLFRASAKAGLGRDFDALPRDMHAVLEALDRRLGRKGAMARKAGTKAQKKTPGSRGKPGNKKRKD
ncbi:MAG: NAD(P)-binding domain-containing protein [Hyphomicrobiales bacterium]